MTLRQSIFDPQGKAVGQGIDALGFAKVKSVRSFAPGLPPAAHWGKSWKSLWRMGRATFSPTRRH
ncbi:MAG: phosphoribosylformylglycinamidine synthase subunit PurS [Bacteroidota bacterium]